MRFVLMLLREPNNRGNKDEYQAEKSSSARICHYLPDHGDTMREDSALDAFDQLKAKLRRLQDPFELPFRTSVETGSA